MSCCLEILAASQSMTQCECVGHEAGWCERHRCRKTEHFRKLCRADPRYYALYEAGRGPGQITPGSVPAPRQIRIPLGTWLARGIKRVTFGKVAPCLGCQSRAAALDRWGAEMWRAPLMTTKTTLRIAWKSVRGLSIRHFWRQDN